jgi:hypothetical protein
MHVISVIFTALLCIRMLSAEIKSYDASATKSDASVIKLRLC